MTYYNLIYQFGGREEQSASERGSCGAASSGNASSGNASSGTASSGTASSRAGGTGPRPFAERAAEVGIEGLVVPDLPAEEADPLREACDEFGLDLVFIVAPTTRGERLERIMSMVSGYVYVQARLGTTGAKTEVSDQTAESLARIAEWDVPKAVGFGISTGEHAKTVVEAGADGVIVGSALVDIVAAGVENDDPAAEVAARLESKARELKDGALAGYAARVPQAEGN